MAEDTRQIAGAAQRKRLTGDSVDHAVIAGDHAENGDDGEEDQMKRVVAPDLAVDKRERERHFLGTRLLVIVARGRSEKPGQDHQKNEGDLRQCQATGNGALRFVCLLGCQGHGFNHHQPPDGKRDGLQHTAPSFRQQWCGEDTVQAYRRDAGNPEPDQGDNRTVGHAIHELCLAFAARPLDQPEHSHSTQTRAEGDQVLYFLVLADFLGKQPDNKRNIATRGNGGANGREKRFQEHGPAHDKPEGWPHGTTAIGQRPACERHGHRQLAQRQNPHHVQGTDKQGGQQHANRAALCQALVPAEESTRDHDAHAKGPDLAHPQRLFERMVPKVFLLIRTKSRCIKHRFGGHFSHGGIDLTRNRGFVRILLGS